MKYHRMRKALEAGPGSRNHPDQALTPVSDDEQDRLEIYQVETAERPSDKDANAV